MDKARFFGEAPTLTYNGAVAALTVTNGVAAINMLTDTIFTALAFAWPVPSPASASLVGVTFVAGTTIYGVKSFTIASGSGIVYFSNPQ